MEHGIAHSPVTYPLLDVCFYGQYQDGVWFRTDTLYPFDTSVEQIQLDCDNLMTRNRRELEIDDRIEYIRMSWLSWGIDSKVFMLNPLTNECGHVGNILFLDFDETGEFENVLRKIAYLQRDKLIKTNPDIVGSGNGFHVYVYEVFDFSVIRAILKKDYIYNSLCDKFFRTTMYLKCSVLRLSKIKKGKEQPLKLLESGYTNNEVGQLYQNFVRRCIDENL